MKFTHGQRVTCKIGGEEIKNAKISIDSDGTPYICQDIQDGAVAEDRLGYAYSWGLYNDFTNSSVTDLKPDDMIELTLEDVAKLKGVDVSRIRIVF